MADGNLDRMLAKHGAPMSKSPYKHWETNRRPITPKSRTIYKKPKKKTRKIIVGPKIEKREWLDIHKEYLRWHKTDDFKKWYHRRMLKQGGTCFYCDIPLIGTKVNVDHIIPKIAGGDNRKSNLVLTCAKCNKDKYTGRISRKKVAELRDKNVKKRGTYKKMRSELFKNYLPTDYVISNIKQIHRENRPFNIDDHKEALEKWKARKQE